MAGLVPLLKRFSHLPGSINFPRQRVSLRWQGGDLLAEAHAVNSVIGVVPYMGPILVIRYATRCGIKNLLVYSHDLYTAEKPKTRAIYSGFECT